MKKPHVVYILTKLELGGAQKVCLSLLDGSKEEGRPATLISGAEGELALNVEKQESVYLLDSFKREVGLKTISFEIKTFNKIIRILRELKKKYPDLVVHTHSTKAGIIGRWAAFFAGVRKRVHTVHGFGFNEYQPWIQWLVIYFFELITSLITTHYVCVSSRDIETGIRLFPSFRRKSSIIRAAVEWDKFYMPATKKPFRKEFVFGTVSCFKPQKNLLDLLEAFKIAFDQKECKLQIVGDGVMRKGLEEWISKNNMEAHVELLGWQKDVAPIMKTWDAYVMSSLWEGLPCTIVEARLIKLPVVAYSVGGIADVIVDGKNGFLVPPGDIDFLARKMSLIMKDVKLYQNMKLHQEDLSVFSNQFMVKEHLRLYDRLF